MSLISKKQEKNKNNPKDSVGKGNIISNLFLIVLIVGVAYLCYLIFESFIVELLVAVMLVSIFYRPYKWLVKKFGGREKLASLTMCILISLLVIIPMVNLIVVAAQKSISAYNEFNQFLNQEGFEQIIETDIIDRFNFIQVGEEELKNVLMDVAQKSSNWLVGGATNVVKGTTNFVVSLVIIIFSMFFFFVDGHRMLRKLMHWLPLPDDYNKEIFRKFKDVSYSSIISTFVSAVAQGLIGAVGFMIVGLPAFFAGIAMGFLSLLPYIGSAFIWFPVAIFLLITGQLWQGIFLLVWGAGIVSLVDNLIRAYIITGKSQVHPIFIIFSILGGISLFGFWGVILGPLIISLAVTVLHIYEMEYHEVLKK